MASVCAMQWRVHTAGWAPVRKRKPAFRVCVLEPSPRGLTCIVGWWQGFERSTCSFSETCSCVGQFLSLPSTLVDDSSFSRPKLSAGSRSPDAEFTASVVYASTEDRKRHIIDICLY